MFDILGPHSHQSAPIDVIFCTVKRTQVPLGTAKCDLNRCNESSLRGENPDFWPVSKNNTGSLPLRGNPAGNKCITSKPMQYRQDTVTRTPITRVELITISTVGLTIRSIWHNSAADFLRFQKFLPQICESCCATYRRNYEIFSAL